MRNIGRYVVDAEIGRGAMGVVYSALDPRLDRRVALKTYAVPDGLAPERKVEFRARFEREARAAAALSHPGIVTVYDVDHDADLDAPYITMEYVEGESLDAVLRRRGRLEPAEARAIALETAAALRAAHTAGIVHRDVKPANILIGTADGRVKLADFGIARLRESELTRAGTALGSPAYMSPEQMRGGEVDARSDLFSLGVVLYRMLTGRRPFEGDDLPALMYAVVHENPIPIGKLDPGLSWGLSRFLDRALAKSPGDRFQDAREFCEALAEASNSGDSEPGVSTIVGDADRSPGVPLRAAAPIQDRADRSGGPWPAVRRPMLVALAVVAVLAPAAIWLAGEPAYIELEGRSTIREGHLTVYVDGDEVYRRELAFNGERGSMSKWIDKVRPASGGETFETVFETTAGRREVEAVLTENGAGEIHRSSVVVDLGDRDTASLKLIAGSSRGAPLTLRRD